MRRVLEGWVDSCGFKTRKKERGRGRGSSSGMEGVAVGTVWEAEPQAPPNPSTCPTKASEALDFGACEGPTSDGCGQAGEGRNPQMMETNALWSNGPGSESDLR